MPMTCKVCEHADLAAIESMRADGAPLRLIARQFALSKDSARRHFANDHGGSGTVVPVASRGALLSPDLDVRAHALLAASDRAVREAERNPGSLGLLRALRGHRAALRSAIWVRKEAQKAWPVSDANRAALEAAWKRSVGAYEATEGRPGPRLMALQGLRESLDALFKASPPKGAFLLELVLTFSDGTPVPGPSTFFWTSDETLRAGGKVQLHFGDSAPLPDGLPPVKPSGGSA